jgi:hypothetical protein
VSLISYHHQSLTQKALSLRLEILIDSSLSNMASFVFAKGFGPHGEMVIREDL